MKDILITKQGKNANVVPKTENAKKIFNEHNQPNGFVVPTKTLQKILAWAVSHNLSVDSKIPIVIPERPFLTQEQLAVIFPNVPKSFQKRTMFAIGTSKFKGDKFTGTTKAWSVNDQFDKGVEYPVYDNEGLFVVGKDGKGYKMTPIAWTKIKEY